MHLKTALPAFVTLLGTGVAPGAHAAAVDADFQSLAIRDTDIQLRESDLLQLDSGLQLRDDHGCEELVAIVERIGTSKAETVWATFGGLTAYYVCKRQNGHNCKELAAAISAGILSIFSLADNISGGIEGRSDVAEAIHEILAKEFDNSNIPYNAITDATEEILALYGEDDQKPVSVSSVHGMNHLNSTPVNLDVYHFGNGQGHVHLPFDMFENRTNTSIQDRVAKRGLVKGPGIKISYTTRTQSKLTGEHKSQMADAIAWHWASNADATSLHDLIGFVETGATANFYWRIIPENNDFALNYETVDYCGGMKGNL